MLLGRANELAASWSFCMQLSSKLDSVIKSSQWMRRKVVLGEENKQLGGRGKLQQSPRRGSAIGGGSSAISDGGALASTSASGSASSAGAAKELSHHDLEKKVMAAFSRSTSIMFAKLRQGYRTNSSLMTTLRCLVL